MIKRRLCWLFACSLAIAAAACGGDDDEGGDGGEAADSATVDGGAETTAASATTVPATTPPTTDAASATTRPTNPEPTQPPSTPAPAVEWAELELTDCMCSDGSPVTFFERAADPTKVVLYFEGGGACFDAATCDPNGSPTYSVSQQGGDVRQLVGLGGYFDFDNPENPLADHSWVYVPYCTGDVHLGNTTTDYGDGIVVEHRGYANASRALEHLVATYPDTEQLVVTGESAGSIPTPLFAALAADQLPAAEIVTFGDSSAGYPDVDPINAFVGQAWGFPNGVPDWPELADITVEQWSFPEQYVYAGQHAPNVRFGRFDFAFDAVQATYGALAGVPAEELVTLIDATEDQIEAAGVAVASYVAPGDSHTIAHTSELYELEVGGVRLIDWLTALINEPAPPPDVHCEVCTQ
jgi:hypothetical protein